MAQCYVHPPRSCRRREYAGNWACFPFSFVHKVIFESDPRAAGTLPEYIGHVYSPQMTRIRPHDSPDITFVIMRIYISDDTVCIADDAHAAWELHAAGARDSRDLVERCTARASIKTRDISISFHRNCKFLHGAGV